ncbi:MAG TPA: hypothetical protein VGO56_09535 [Pyrinomonadaceae bacterium]|jgi:hypothetical protein|nr:hypothetical protein [Pyrinomonadaceae bacterium]
MSLREGGIYRLPNGRELVVLRKNEDDARRLKLRGWERFEMSEYEVNESGRLLSDGKLTAWDVGHLRDTGRTAPDLLIRSKTEIKETKL